MIILSHSNLFVGFDMTILKVNCKACEDGAQYHQIAVDDFNLVECECCHGAWNEQACDCTNEIEIGFDYDGMGYATMDEAMQALYNDYDHLNLDDKKDHARFLALCKEKIAISYY